MKEGWKEMFKTSKPVIAMAHLPALPGTPRYDKGAGIEGIIQRVRQDIAHLVDGGVDAIMFCNEDDRPYTFQAGVEAIATMARVVAETRPVEVPFGVDFLWDAKAALAIATATGAAFMREVITGVYESDMGFWQPDAAALYRYRRQIDAEGVRIFANITPEFASSIGDRSIAERAKSVVVSTVVDAILISGPMAGSEPDLSALQEAKDAIGGAVPLFLNTGAKIDNIGQFLRVADGVIVGSSLKVDGYTWNPVDPQRVKRFMERVGEIRTQNN